MVGQPRARDHVVEEPAVVDHHLRPALDDPLELLVLERREADRKLTQTSVAAEIIPPTSELSPPLIEFCTAFDSTSSSTRSNDASWPT